MSEIRVPDEYSYIYDIVRCVRDGKPVVIDEFNTVGGRRSGKSTTWQLLYALLCEHCDNSTFGFVGVRHMVSSARDLLQDFTQTFDSYAIDYKVSWSNSNLTINNNTLRVIGVNDNRKTQKARKAGFPRFSNVKYVFIFFEERFEFSEQDVRAVVEAIRSTNTLNIQTQYIVINACNPWAKSSPYITYCSKYLTWDVKQLRETGSQIAVVDIPLGDGRVKRALFHYTNWRVAKEFLSESEINNILDTWNYDKKRALTADLGLPGYEDGAIYTHVLSNLGKAIYQEHTWLLAGGDYGWGQDDNSGKTVFMFGGASLESGIDIYHEYVQDNHTRVKTPDVVAEEVVKFYVNCMRDYCNRIGWASPFNLSVRVDNMAVGFIQILNSVAQKYKLSWLKFVKCKKFLVSDRIQITLAIMGRQFLRLGEDVKLLKNEMEFSRYSENGTTEKRLKINDHAINAYEYLLEPVMYKFAKLCNLKEFILKEDKLW